MSTPPPYRPPTAPLTHRPLTDAEAKQRARVLLAEALAPDVEAAPETAPDTAASAPAVPLSYRDRSPLPAIGTTPPVPQPGRPPMSPRATDTAALLLTGSVATLAAGGSVSLVLLTLSAVDPADLGIAAGGGVALILALAGLVSRLGRATRDAQPVTHHHTYNAPITQTSYTSHTSGLGRTRNTSEGR